MRTGLILFSMAMLSACGGNGGKNPVTDSLGNTITDTAARNDTMNYERMQSRTGNADSAGQSNQRKNDTAYYERLPQKRDSVP